VRCFHFISLVGAIYPQNSPARVISSAFCFNEYASIAFVNREFPRAGAIGYGDTLIFDGNWALRSSR
jgi:hypothetical protein